MALSEYIKKIDGLQLEVSRHSDIYAFPPCGAECFAHSILWNGSGKIEQRCKGKERQKWLSLGGCDQPGRRGRKRSQMGERPPKDKTEIRMGSAKGRSRSLCPASGNDAKSWGCFSESFPPSLLLRSREANVPLTFPKAILASSGRAGCTTFFFLPKGSVIWQTDPVTH